jgi:AAA domain
MISTEAEKPATSRIAAEPPAESKIPEHILADTAPAGAEAPQPKSKPNGYPHGERDTGTREVFYIYLDARGRKYLGVQRTSTKQFPQYHWTGQQWQKGLPKGFVKIPYRLPELLDAPADAWVVIAAGEKDAETAARLGFVATTNSGGEGKGQWTPELSRWFAGKQRVAVMEDNDDTGQAHAIEVANALCGSVPDIRIVTFRELPEHGDLTDWVDGFKHSKNDLLTRIKATAPYSAELDEWDAGELLSDGTPIEPRQWLLARCFCRTFLSGLVAPGDAGKTTLRLTQAIELATGRELLGHHVYQRCKVLVLSLEDDREELRRRLAAICKHHNIDPAELKGWLFCRDLKRVKLATRDKNGERQVGPLEGMLRRAIARTRCDLLVLDPFVKLHALAENDNADMDFVCEQLIAIAQDCNIAVDSPAHTHKGAITAGDADARRGASAQRDAGRLDYTFTVMSEDEAAKFGIHPDERKSYVRLDKAKANLTRAIKAEWFRLVSVRLGNATPLYPEGDDMQAIERWTPPETWAGADGETLNAILDAVNTGLSDGRRYIDHGRASEDRAAWAVVQKYCPSKPEAQCRDMIKQWLKAGVLYRAKYHNPIRREDENGLFVDPNKRPQY